MRFQSSDGRLATVNPQPVQKCTKSRTSQVRGCQRQKQSTRKIPPTPHLVGCKSSAILARGENASERCACVLVLESLEQPCPINHNINHTQIGNRRSPPSDKPYTALARSLSSYALSYSPSLYLHSRVHVSCSGEHIPLSAIRVTVWPVARRQRTSFLRLTC